MKNKLLEMISEEELRRLIFNQFISPNGIAELYNVGAGTVFRAIDICNITLDKEIWYPGSSWEQRRLLLSDIKLTDLQHQIIVGSLLGDGGIRASSKTHYFTIDQCKAHKGYIDWLQIELEPFSKMVKEVGTLQPTTNTISKGYRFITLCHPELTRYYNLFYPEDKKVVPPNIGELLTPLGLAIWYCDDGSNNQSARSSSLWTNCFTEEGVYLLIDVLYRKFNVRASLRYFKGTYRCSPVIDFMGTGYDDWHNLVDRYVKKLNCFQYKVGRARKEIRRGERHPNSKLTEGNVREIRRLFLGGLKYQELAEIYNIGKASIQNIVLRRAWQHVA